MPDQNNLSFVPLLEEPPLPVRSNHINSLIQVRSQSLRSISINQSGKCDVENAIHASGKSSSTGIERNVDKANQPTLSPEGRSQRLIGDSNPRYDW